MFRGWNECLAGINDENSLDYELYLYLSSAISKTIKDCIDEFLDDIERFDLFFQYSFSNTFFEGLSQYVKPKALCPGGNKADEQAGYEFTFAKMKRMREKMMDQIEYSGLDYTACPVIGNRYSGVGNRNYDLCQIHHVL